MSSAQCSASPSATIIELRITPAAESIQSRKAGTLLAYQGRLFSSEEMLCRLSERALYAAFEHGPNNAHDWWEAVCRIYPNDAKDAASRCASFGLSAPCRILPFRR